MSNNLNITQMSASQAQKEQTSNDANGELDAAITEFSLVDLTAANQTLTLTQVQRAVLFRLTGNTVTRTVIFPATKRLVYVENTGTSTVTLQTGTTTINLPSASSVSIYLDGTANGMSAVGGSGSGGGASAFTSLTDAPSSYTGAGGKTVRVNAGATGLEFVDTPYDVAFFIPGLPVAGAKVFKHKVGRTMTLPTNLSGSQGNADASTGTATFDIQKNGVSFGSITFTASTTPTFTTTATSFAVGDILTVVAPSPQDATLADVAITILGTKV